MNLHDLYEMLQKEFDPLFKTEEKASSSEIVKEDTSKKQPPYLIF